MLLDRLQRPFRGVRIVHKSPSPDDPDSVSVQIIPYRRLDDHEVQRVLAQVADNDSIGRGRIVTSALASSEQTAFRAAGFVDREALHLLRHSLNDIPVQSGTPVRTRAGRRTDLSAVLTIDRASFDRFWALDRDAFTAAKKATPTHRYRIALVDGTIAGYAITGRAAQSSFLQRLGVAPEHRGKGIGSQLVIDAMNWAKADGASSMLVNTQTSNENALRLYESLGFALSAEKLMVLQWNQ